MDARRNNGSSNPPDARATGNRVANDVQPPYAARTGAQATYGGLAPIWSRVASLLRQLADAVEGQPSSPGAGIVDQYQSPLGKRRHLKLVREGKLKGYKPDRVHVFVELSEIMAYLKKHPAISAVAPTGGPSDTHERDPRRIARQLRAELGLVPARKRA
jgi:hypothetical protein